jgi:hypothetical protein
LDDPPAVVAVGQRAKVDREKKEWCPVTDDGKPAENRRMKFLKQQPVTDHVLDVIAHGREQVNQKIPSIIAMMQSRERDFPV